MAPVDTMQRVATSSSRALIGHYSRCITLDNCELPVLPTVETCCYTGTAAHGASSQSAAVTTG